ncbi:DUF427 domain-containing protein [Haliangium ochraceum]|uniref:DUF427 domain-containing protein n=1 Tax=Haliangium ochraceum (strain DSM 14365 / JCM 11303 / SMP-2) TaxID=502025 RepID=D0LKM2_HALO1|nr:DUF427 domain-containing protein [Haliangium ochraceum]ACY15070.1 protein of unknown function DUF427 [Haliangium ochraceum DSM 14365]
MSINIHPSYRNESGQTDQSELPFESVWDYPRPPRLEACLLRLRVVFAGRLIAETRSGLRVVETSHPPNYYIPLADVAQDYLELSRGRSMCEFKGAARYWDIRVGDRVAKQAAWGYPKPLPTFASLRDHLAFYPGRVDAAYVGDERVQPQEGEFYGGWITSNLRGPFKGGPGTTGW